MLLVALLKKSKTWRIINLIVAKWNPESQLSPVVSKTPDYWILRSIQCESSKPHSFLYWYDLQNSKADSFVVRMTFIPELPVIYTYI